MYMPPEMPHETASYQKQQIVEQRRVYELLCKELIPFRQALERGLREIDRNFEE